ncbi:MAG: protein restricted to Verrucomicrobia-Planctomycetes group [Phycisphaerales bacterium]|nr:protein restricted to Verrucomicrobia-Planctomycetes group [Phycisphaerales bacterium]
MGEQSLPIVQPDKTVEDAAEACGRYAVEAFYFVQKGLAVTATRIHAERPDGHSRHITGQELAQGLRDLAIQRWGLLARTVLSQWGVNTTLDFGRIVYAMIDAGIMGRCDEDQLADFKSVYDFRSAFSEQRYKIAPMVTA